MIERFLDNMHEETKIFLATILYFVLWSVALIVTVKLIYTFGHDVSAALKGMKK